MTAPDDQVKDWRFDFPDGKRGAVASKLEAAILGWILKDTGDAGGAFDAEARESANKAAKEYEEQFFQASPSAQEYLLMIAIKTSEYKSGCFDNYL